MRRIIFTLYALALPASFYAQNVGIGISSPHASALLDISSTSKGLLIPRMSAAQMNVITSPAAGLFVYNTNDSSFYTRRLASWNKVSYGEDHLWRKFGSKTFLGSGNYVGINYSDLAALNLIGNYAPFQTRGMVGNTLAEFGEDVQGITLVGNYPGVFFNSYFNSGVKAITAGGTGNITLNQSNPHYYEFSFGDYASYADQPMTNTVRMALRSDGRLFLGNGNLDFSRANFEQQGTVGNTAAIFGGEGTGISLQHNWPAIGFNSYLDGSNHKSIGAGYAAQLGLDQQNGSLYLVSFPFNAQPNTLFSGFTQRFYISRFGNLGIGTGDPQADIEIAESNISADANLHGLRLSSFGNSWNISKFKDDFLKFYFNGVVKGSISFSDGSYSALSDERFKKNINSLQNTDILNKILQLRAVTYLMKEEPESGKYHLGFIAQEVEKIFPQVVSESGGVKTMNYSGLIPVAIQALQEQQQQIEKLKKDNESLKNEMAELRKLILSKQ